ncbi:MAG: AarF/ABC1/UbiB kinase family protein [Acidobacteriota bacterium]
MSSSKPSWRRVFGIARVVARHVWASVLSRYPMSLLARALPPQWTRDWRQRQELPEPLRLRGLFEELGGSFLKLGQMLALQPDVLPAEYCDALYDLLDRVPPISFADVEQVFEQELGARPLQVFDHFDSKPIASASVGQVHVAWLHGRKLAVKVQRPTADQQFGGDSRILEWFANLTRFRCLQRFRFLAEPIREVVEWTRDELNYRREAEFLRAMSHSAEGRPHQTVPRVETGLTTRRILTMEFLEGISLLDYLRAMDAGDQITLHRLTEMGFDPEIFAARIIDNFLEQTFVDGVFHADLHPANLMILPGNTVGYLDLGITGTLGVYSRRQLATMTLAYTRGDIDAMWRAFTGISDADEPALERYRQGLVRLADDWYDRSPQGRRLRKSVSMVMLDMLRLSAETEVWAQRDVIKYIRSSVATDGLITRCAPRVDVSQHLGHACRRHMAHLFGSPAANLGRSLGGFLVDSATGVGNLLRGGQSTITLLDRLSQGDMPPLKVELAPRSSCGTPTPPPRRQRRRPRRRQWAGPSMLLQRPKEVALVLVALSLLTPSGSTSLSSLATLGIAPLVLLAAVALPSLRFRMPRARRRLK